MNTLKTLPDGNIQITIDYVFVKRSGRKQIVMKEDRENPENLDMGVIRALARGRYWNSKLDNGEYSTIREIAEIVGIDESYVARIIRLSALSPFIVRTFLNGTSPSDLRLLEDGTGDDQYLSFVISKTRQYSEWRSNLLCAILEISSDDELFPILYGARKKIISHFDNADMTDFIRESYRISDPSVRICYILNP